MNFGQRLKQLRQSKGWSQPELAQAIGIEQSYLSKLENDKSAPSPDMLNRILEAFDIDIETLLQGMDEAEIRKHLRSIPQVNGHLQAQKENARRKSKRWVIASALLCVFGITIMVMGIGFTGDSIVIYDYGSEEIVPNGEAGETFSSLESFLGYKLAPTLDDLISRNVDNIEMARQSDRAYSSLELQYSSLTTPAYQFSYEYQGNSFIEKITEGQDLINLQATGESNGGSRTFELSGTRSELIPYWLGFGAPGAFTLVLGIFGFIIERKLYPKMG